MFWILTCFEKTMFALQEGFTFNFTALIIQKAFTVLNSLIYLKISYHQLHV